MASRPSNQGDQDDASPEAKRKKIFRGSEIVNMLTEKKHRISEVCRDITQSLCPFDVNEVDKTGEIAEKLEKLDKVTKLLTATISRLSKDFKARKFKNHPELLEEVVVSCSQYSILQSQSENESQDAVDEDYEEEEESQPDRPEDYRKRPLNSEMTQRTRRRRIKENKTIVEEWAQEEGVTPSQLLGIKIINHSNNYSFK